MPAGLLTGLRSIHISDPLARLGGWVEVVLVAYCVSFVLYLLFVLLGDQGFLLLLFSSSSFFFFFFGGSAYFFSILLVPLVLHLLLILITIV